MKRALSLILATALLLAFAACGKAQPANDTGETESQTETTLPEETMTTVPDETGSAAIQAPDFICETLVIVTAFETNQTVTHQLKGKQIDEFNQQTLRKDAWALVEDVPAHGPITRFRLFDESGNAAYLSEFFSSEQESKMFIILEHEGAPNVYYFAPADILKDISAFAEKHFPSTRGAESSTAAETAAAAKIPETKEELVAYFNQVSNQVKIGKPGFTWTQQTFVSNIESSSSAIEWAAGAAMRFVPLEVLEMPSAAKGADHNEQFNVRGQAWSSRLTPQAVSNAKLTDKGSAWELRVDLKPEKRNGLPKTESDHDHGKVFTVMTYSSIHDIIDPYAWLATMESFAPSYHDSWAVLTVDKETDCLIKAEYMLTYDVAARAKFAVIPAFDATATISMHEIYKIG